MKLIRNKQNSLDQKSFTPSETILKKRKEDFRRRTQKQEGTYMEEREKRSERGREVTHLGHGDVMATRL